MAGLASGTGGISNVLAKLDCPNRTVAVAKALRQGLCEHYAASGALVG